MTWLLTLPWGRIGKVAAVVGLVVVMIGGPLYIGWKVRERIADLETDLANEKSLREAAETRLELRQTALDTCNTTARKAAADAAAYQARLDEELAKPDRVVVRYREVPSPPEIIESSVCPEAVAQTLAFVRRLAAAEMEGPP